MPTLSRRSFLAAAGAALTQVAHAPGAPAAEPPLKFKLGLAVSSLENGKWRSANHRIHSVLPQLNAMFQSRFEGTL